MNNLVKTTTAAAVLAISSVTQAGLPEGISAFKEKDYFISMKELMPLAETGDKVSQFIIAMHYRDGLGVEADKGKTFYWLKKSADQNYVHALVHLAGMYEAGLAVPINKEEAIRLFHLAATQGSAEAEFCLSRMYLTGPTKDRTTAMGLLRSASDKGLAVAQEYLAVELLNQNQNDFEEPMRLLGLAAKQGNLDAEARLGVLFLRSNKKEYQEKGRILLDKNARGGSPIALFALGIHLYDEVGDSESKVSGLKLITAAANAGSTPALEFLMKKNINEEGVIVSEITAWILARYLMESDSPSAEKYKYFYEKHNKTRKEIVDNAYSSIKRAGSLGVYDNVVAAANEISNAKTWFK